MRLNTRIFNSEGEQINYEKSEHSGDTLVGLITVIDIIINDEIVGSMKFSIQEDHLYIHRMDNFSVKSKTPYKHVGYLLFEYAFQKSIEAGKEGKIELDAIEASPAAYYKMGLRKKSPGGISLEGLISQYLSTNSIKTKNDILSHNLYNSLKRAAAENLKKDINEVSFKEAIKNGIYSPLNENFAMKLAENNKLTSADCYNFGMHGIMYLPPEMIEIKRHEFSNFKAIGSNKFFSTDNDSVNEILKTKQIVEEDKSAQLNFSCNA